MSEKCETCGDALGAGTHKNALYFCDERGGPWCGDCFGAVRCEELHGEGCATLAMDGSPAPHPGDKEE